MSAVFKPPARNDNSARGSVLSRLPGLDKRAPPSVHLVLRRGAVGALLALCGCATPEGMARVPAGSGVEAFLLDRHEVTTERFARFIERTGRITDAERLGWSLVFHAPGTAPGDAPAVPGAPWWVRRDGADWRTPRGPDRSEAAPAAPAVQVSWNDAAAFCAESGGRLPTAVEWEHAARGGTSAAIYPWGRRSPFAGSPPANLFDGRFPFPAEARDGFVGLAPVGSFPPNGYGLFDMAGNAWEWVDGGSPESRPIRGGSFLCAENSCQGYRLAWENRAPADSAWDHTGFRCVGDS